jgi:hypothetical protein
MKTDDCELELQPPQLKLTHYQKLALIDCKVASASIPRSKPRRASAPGLFCFWCPMNRLAQP